MINYKNHEITSIKFYCSQDTSDYSFSQYNIDNLYNELFSCCKCGWKGWNFNFVDDEDILTCEEFIIKCIIE